jgi:hypothetical protein
MAAVLKMPTFDDVAQKDWLQAFVSYAGYGEASPRLMYWVGVSTIAAALGRKVWFDQDDFQWSPNFYILIVGEQGAVRKSTSIDVGMRLLKQVDGVMLGPSSATWQALLQKIDKEAFREIELADGKRFGMSCITLPLSEFGTFFKPDDRELLDVLTDLWDGKLGAFEKITKTSGNDTIRNPWINLIAATTPNWVSRNLTDDLLGGGLISRFIFLHGEMPERDIAYPKRHMPKDRDSMRHTLIGKLREIADNAGPVELTDEAYQWGEQWYRDERNMLRKVGFGSLEAGFLVRKQVHLHKLAMVIAAARGALPTITLEHLQEADRQLRGVDEDARRVLAVTGQTKITAAARQIYEAVKTAGGSIVRGRLYARKFSRTMDDKEYDLAIRSAIHAGLIAEEGNLSCTVLVAKEQEI